MALKIRAVEVLAFEAELKRPFVTALGRKTSSPNVGVLLFLSDGSQGYGEASASLALAHLSSERLARALSETGRWARGQDASCPGDLVERAWKRLAGLSPAAAAFECALLSACAAGRGLSLTAWLGGALRELETDITLSAWNAGATFAAAAEARGEGFRLFKVKVVGRPAEDLARLRAVRRACPGARLILDGNQSLTPDGALSLVDACLKEGPVALLEQPLPKDSLSKMPALARRCPVAIALDESVSTPEDALRAADLGACGAINIKVAKSGLARSLRIAAVARAAGLKLMIGCMTETAAGLAPSVALAMGTGFFDFVDLDSDHLLKPGGRAADFKRDGPRLRATSEWSPPARVRRPAAQL